MKLFRFLHTAWQLFWDPKVPSVLKLFLPVLALIYWISPIDLMPFFPLDDFVVVALALKMFVELAQVGHSSQPDGYYSTNGSVTGDSDEEPIVTTWRVVDDDS